MNSTRVIIDADLRTAKFNVAASGKEPGKTFQMARKSGVKSPSRAMPHVRRAPSPPLPGNDLDHRDRARRSPQIALRSWNTGPRRPRLGPALLETPPDSPNSLLRLGSLTRCG